ncbi:uncharacterized protein LOC110461476 [Mizuhopecten yessoensis]|uniref:uncharacterized protein LOC110461476 n=1 Tax=Mizuhopecten yessoensis TaxID=6573 RepID=UPI000B45E4A7|nr:uncharacterized protein LOC110461476 [Mizuhopecten yessoensis]
MDDCNLEKLAVKPGKLTPAFNKDTTDYNVTVASNVEKIRIDPLTSDTGASYSISGSGGEKEVGLPEGVVTDIKIEVTSEDGTVKNYLLHVKRLSAKDAVLSDLKFSQGGLMPEFDSAVTVYSCILPCNVASVTAKPVAPDPKNVVLVCGEKPGTASPLNVGETNIQIEVTSADGSNKQTYSVDVLRKPMPRYAKFTDPDLAQKYECPISLSPLYRPISIRGSEPKHTYSAPNIDAMTRTAKVDPISGVPLMGEWRIVDIAMEKQMAAAQASIPLTYGGSSDAVKFGELAANIEKCNVTPKVEDVKDKFKDSSATLKHTVKVRGWEKNLQQIFGESNVDKLVGKAKDEIKTYFKILPKPGQSKQWPEGEGPLDCLLRAAYCYAVAISNKPKDSSLHLQLGMVLEERYYAEDLFGLKKEESDSLPSMNMDAKESSKSEECAAICKLHSVDAETAPLSLQLKAIDEEYQQLNQNGQSAKADHVMGLFAWKSKQAKQEGAAAQKAEDEESPLGQAFLKYMDALVLDEPKAMHNFHVGRMLVIQGKYDEAIKRLEVTLNWNSQYQLARFYLGLALAFQPGGPGARTKETIGYLLEIMETLLQENTKDTLSAQQTWELNPVLHAENIVRSSNVHLLRGIISLGVLLTMNPDIKDCMAAQDVFHTAALLASQILPKMSKGDTFKQVEWVLLDAHSYLLNMLSSKQSGQEKIIAQRCMRLSALIFSSSIPMNEQLLQLQEKTCQQLVQIQPCSSHALYLLGAAQFAQYENTPPGDSANTLLQHSISSYEVSIDLEGKPMAGNPLDKLTGQDWWQQKIKAEEEKKKAEEAKKAGPAVKPAGRGAPAVRGAARGAPAVRGAARGAPAARGRGTPPARGGVAARGAARGGAAAAKAPVGKAAPAKPAAKTHHCDPKAPVKQEEVPAAKAPASTTPPADTTAPAAPPKGTPINRTSYYPHLGLARAFRAAGNIQESQTNYNDVITMTPEVHDAYIELAEMLTKTDPAGAVDVYSKFPMPEEPSFDDAFIIGELVRLLMKTQSYDDPRLQTYMISYGRVLGLGVLERYVKVLEDKFKTELLKKVYAGVNRKDVDDPDLEAFFKFKCWF